MKKKLTKNIGLKILSVILAAILWLVITNVDNPEETKRISNVPVEVLNGDVIASLDQVYDITEGETIDFTIEAPRKIRDELNKADFVVTADFSNMSAVNSVPIEISCPRYGDEVTIVDGKYQFMKVSLEELIKEPFKVNIKQNGEVAEGSFVGESTSSPNIIQVSGPKGRVERIAEVVVDVDVTGVSESFHATATPKVLDTDGNEIDASKLTFSESIIVLDIAIYKTKPINLQITVTGEPAYGYAMTNREYEPKTITVAGDDAALKSISYLGIEESIAGATENIEKEINLQDELPEGIFLVGEDKTAVINITIEKMVTKDVTIWPGDIEPRNKPVDLNLNYNTVGPVIISVMGIASEMNDISRLDIKPYFDLTGYLAGTYTITFNIDPLKHLTLVNAPFISFNLEKEPVVD